MVVLKSGGGARSYYRTRMIVDGHFAQKKIKMQLVYGVVIWGAEIGGQSLIGCDKSGDMTLNL